MRRLALLFGRFLLTALSGCATVQSFHPFYASEPIVGTPEKVEGSWRIVEIRAGREDPRRGDAGKASEGLLPWEFLEGKLTCYDECGRAGTLETVFFHVGGELLCDFSMESPGRAEDICFYEVFHVVNVHTVAKVIVENDRLTLQPFNLGWLADAERVGAIKLSYVESADVGTLYTCTSEEWENFLAAYSTAEPGPFGDDLALILERAKGTGPPAVEDRRRPDMGVSTSTDRAPLGRVFAALVAGMGVGALLAWFLTRIRSRSRRPVG